MGRSVSEKLTKVSVKEDGKMEKEREEQVISLCQKLIQQKSYSGEESGVVGVLSENMKQMGFDEVTVDKYGNIIGCIKGNRPGKKFYLTDISIRFR